jgi:hypothetical protein
MLLQFHQSFDILAEYDPATGGFAAFSRSAEPARVHFVQGTFDYLSGKRVILYRLAGVLYLDVDGERVPVEDHVVEVRPLNGDRVLRVRGDRGLVFEVAYSPRRLDPPLSEDPTAFIDEEDFDFGLFLRNVSRDRERQSRIYFE